MAPVCEVAARLPSAVLPAFMAAILAPLLMREEACFNSFWGFEMVSKYNNFIEESIAGSKCKSMCSKISSTLVWAALPTENTCAKETPSCIPASIIKTAVAPEPEIKSQPLGLKFGTGAVKTPL